MNGNMRGSSRGAESTLDLLLNALLLSCAVVEELCKLPMMEAALSFAVTLAILMLKIREDGRYITDSK
jgi:hypothetical protein